MKTLEEINDNEKDSFDYFLEAASIEELRQYRDLPFLSERKYTAINKRLKQIFDELNKRY